MKATALVLEKERSLTPQLRQLQEELDYTVNRNVLPHLAYRGYDFEPVGVAPLLGDNHLVVSRNGNPWVLTPLEKDPIWQAVERGVIGEYPIPEKQRAQLLSMAEDGYRFPARVVAHELQPGTNHLINPGRPIPLELVAPMEMTQVVRSGGAILPANPALTHLGGAVSVIKQKAPVVLDATGRGVKAAMPVVGSILKYTGLAAGYLALGLGTALGAAVLGTFQAIAADPIIFGCVSLSKDPKPGDPVYYIAIARWDYNVRRL